MKIYKWEDHNSGKGEKFNMALTNAEWCVNVPFHGHLDFCEWVFVLSGEMRHEINGITNIDVRGMVTLIRPQDVHVMKGKEFSIVTLNILPSWLTNFDTLWGMPNLCKKLFERPRPPRIRLSEEETRTAEELCMKVLALRHGIFACQHVTALLSIILAKQFNLYANVDARKMEDAPSWFRETIDWLESNADHPITMEQLHHKACRSSAHISREFMKQLHCTPTEYLRQQKLTKAANLLLSSHLSIQEISVMSGFSNLSHFCRSFKEHYKQSPRHYREFYTKGPEEA